MQVDQLGVARGRDAARSGGTGPCLDCGRNPAVGPKDPARAPSSSISSSADVVNSGGCGAQGNMRVRRYSHLQLHVAVPAYSQVTQQRAGNATAATCTRRFLQVSVRPVLSVYLQSHLQFTCNSKSSKCNIKLYNMIKCSAKSLVPTWQTLWGCGEFRTTFLRGNFGQF